jgi:alkaline phosphatase
MINIMGTLIRGVTPAHGRRPIRRPVGLAIVVTLAVGHLLAGQLASAADPSLIILPIDRAKFLAGQQFDFRVEASNLSDKPTGWEVTIDSKSAEAFFGKAGQMTNTTATSQEQTFRDVTLSDPGRYKVTATVTVGGVPLSKTIEYEAVTARPSFQQAENVILMIGDGMTLPIRTAARLVLRHMTEGKYHAMIEKDDMDRYAAVTTSGMYFIATDSANSVAVGHPGKPGRPRKPSESRSCEPAISKGGPYETAFGSHDECGLDAVSFSRS